MRKLAALFVILAALALPANAQSDDKSVLEELLERVLSDAGRVVEVTGFSGALSSRAEMESLTIADRRGVWLRLSGVTLDWNRAALLTRKLLVKDLHAREIEVLRRPDTPDGPSAQASGFAIPELPVEIDISRLLADRVVLGADILGQAAVLSLSGAGHLGDGAASVTLDVERTDGASGAVQVAAGFDNLTRALAVDVTLSEGGDGILATQLGLPGAPPLDLSVTGSAPIEAFSARLTLATDGVERLGGVVEVASTKPSPDLPADVIASAALTGDLRPLLAADYAAFFGPQTALSVRGARGADGTLRFDAISLAADALKLSGAAAFAPDGWPTLLKLSGRVGAEGATPVLLPMSGSPTRITGAEIAVDFDAARGPGWTAEADVQALARAGLSLDAARLSASGDIGSAEGARFVAGELALSLSGLSPTDPDLAEALGQTLEAAVSFRKAENGPVDLSSLRVEGADFVLTGSAALETDLRALDLIATLDTRLEAQRLARFAALSGFEGLAGAAALPLTGEVSLPNGPFDLTVAGETRELALGIAPLDGLVAGAAQVSGRLQRTLEQTILHDFHLSAPGGDIQAEGVLGAETGQVTLAADIRTTTRLDPALSGAASLSAKLLRAGETWSVTAEATGPGALAADLAGEVRFVGGDPGPFALSLDAHAETLAPWRGLIGRDLSGALSASGQLTGDLRTGAWQAAGTGTARDLALGLGAVDALLSGPSELRFALASDGATALPLGTLALSSDRLVVDVTPDGVEGQAYAVSARLADLSVLVPGLPGPVSVDGVVTPGAETHGLDLSVTGPAGSRAQIAGDVAASGGQVALAIRGQAPLALANGFIAPNRLDGTASFDLRMDGTPGLAALSGQVTTGDGRLSLPALRIALDPVQANIRLANGRARIEAGADVSSGGRIEVAGPVTLAAPYNAELALRLGAVGLTDPALYDTQVSGELTVLGALTGGARISGRLVPGAVEIRIPSSGFGSFGEIDGLRHINEPAAVRATRARAGLTGQTSGGIGLAYPLDIEIAVPNQVFIRGRGLDAELGGQFRLAGTTANVEPVGGLELIRGRLTLLGNRIELDEARATLSGGFDSEIALRARTAVEDVSIEIAIDGEATAPVFSFTSAPELPEDEVLALLILGRSLSEISPLQALRLANGIATLTGRSGAGVVGRLREGFGLADLDLRTDTAGNVTLQAGTYLSENIYTGVEVGSQGEAEVQINLDLTPNLTARGSVATSGEASLGIFFEKDY